MARDDMRVLMYKALSYLYTCMKNGTAVDADMLSHSSELFFIPYPYWCAIWNELIDMKLVKGIKRLKTGDGWLFAFEEPSITLKGVDFLLDNKKMRKVAKFLKGLKPSVSIG